MLKRNEFSYVRYHLRHGIFRVNFRKGERMPSR
jgi:hypothetical protein